MVIRSKAPSPWWPSRYGLHDTKGALNEITATGVVNAASLVRTGEIVDLAHILDDKSPAFPGRTFKQWVHEFAPEGGIGDNEVHWVAERFEATSQMGTHVDCLNHLQQGDRCYNGQHLKQILTDTGTNRLGAETLPQVVTRGVLLNISAIHDQPFLDPGYAITPEDAQAALDAAEVAIQPGDAVLFHTGWGQKWDDDPSTYITGEPGPGTAMINWLARRRVAITGCDTWSFGPVPAENPLRPFIVPQQLNTHFGVVIMENLRLRDLVKKSRHEFMFVMSHPKLRGATGAWTAPLAIL